MCTFDAPIIACEVCGAYVLRDQSNAQCAAEHDCDMQECPLADAFETDAARFAPAPVFARE